MKKKNIRKYILEALAVLLVIGACLTVNELSRKEAYADTINVTSVTLTTRSTTGDQYGVDFSSLAKPTIDSITVDTGNADTIKATLNINWNSSSYDQHVTTAQTIRGTITSSNADVSFNSGVDSVSFTVTLGAPKVTAVNLSGGTATGQYGGDFNSLTIPTIDTITVDNGDNAEIKSGLTIAWNTSTYNPRQTTEQTISGTVQSSDSNVTFDSGVNQVSCRVTLGAPRVTAINLSSTTATGNYGDSFSIITKPTISTITVENGDADSIKNTLSINWSDSGYSSTQTTAQTINGTVVSSDSNVTFGSGANSVSCRLTLSAPTVTAVTISPTSISGKVGDSFAKLEKPRITDITVEHGNKQYVLGKLSINWNESEYVSSLETEQSISGTVTSADSSISISSGAQSKTMRVTLVSESTIENHIKNYAESKLEEKTESSDGFSVTASDFNDDFARKLLLYLYNNGSSEVKSAIQNAAISGTTSITFTLKAKKGSPSDSHKESMEKKVEDNNKGAKISDYFDLSLQLKIGNSSYSVSDTGDDIDIKVKVPGSSQKSTRKYNVVRYHEGSTILNGSYSELKDDRIAFSTHYFSDYAISYTDSSSSSSSSSASTPKSNSAIVPGDDGTGAGAGGTDKSKTPKTGDDFNPRIWIYLLIVCATVASAAWILLQDTREDNEKKQN